MYQQLMKKEEVMNLKKYKNEYMRERVCREEREGRNEVIIL